MISMILELNGDGAFRDWAERDIIHLANGAPPVRIAGLAGGMKSGAPSVAMGLELPDGRVVVAETSLKLFLAAADALRAKFGDQRIHEVVG